jgi:hypothetical protein
MGLPRDLTARQLAGLTELLALRLADATAVSGLSRSSLYRYAAAGRLILKKSGSVTLVDAASLRQLIADLPILEIRRAEVPGSMRGVRGEL